MTNNMIRALNRSWSLTCLSSGAGIFVLACTAALLGIDIYLYQLGLSWTPVHYESLAPLLSMGTGHRWRTTRSAAAAALMFGIFAVLFFAFGLSYKLAAESWIFISGTVIASVVWLQPVWVQAWGRRCPPLGFILVAAGLLVTDKTLSHDMLASAYLPHFFKATSKSIPSASNNSVYKLLKKRLSANHGGVLIVFESLGVAKDKSTFHKLTQAYPKFEISTIEFEGGSTLPAEIRYLCGINGAITDYSPCLPRNIKSSVMHGNTLAYFNRNIIYRDIGFSKINGKHELTALNICRYAYIAVCDQAIWTKLLEEVRASKCSNFHYLLTIDSHFPYTKYTNHVEGLYSDLHKLLEVVNIIANEHPDCQIIIAGDHPPPLSPEFESHQVLMINSHH